METDDQLWRLGSYEPELVVLDVDLAGRVIEHEHGFRASDQRVRSVTVGNTCVRCGRPAVTMRRHLFGALTPACAKHAQRPVALDEVGAELGVPVVFSSDDPTPAPRGKRLRFVLAQLVAPILILVVGLAVAFATTPACRSTSRSSACSAGCSSGRWCSTVTPPTSASAAARPCASNAAGVGS